MNKKMLARIKRIYRYKTFPDIIERIYRSCKEKILNFDFSIFEKTILYYKEEKGIAYTPQAALSIAMNKEHHKNQWFSRPRNCIDEIMHFYQEVNVYPFRQPYLKRFGGFRWYRELIRHKQYPAILEYGCGSAVLTEWLISHFPLCHYSLADIPSVTLDFVKWKKSRLNYNYEILTIGPGKEGMPLHKVFDLIICEDVLEHTPNPLEIVMSFVNHLSLDGVLIIDFINLPGGENIIEATAQREAVKEYLRKHLFPVKLIDEMGSNNGLYIKVKK